MKYEIKPHTSVWDINWREIWDYRDLLWLLVKRDFVATYKQSVLGPAWFVIQPLATTLVFTVIFGRVAKVSTDTIPPFLFYLCGTVLWNYFQGCMTSVATSLIANAGIFRKVYYPRIISPLSMVISNLGQLILNGLVFALFLGYYIMAGSALRPTYWLFYTPFLVLESAIIGLGVGLWFSALTTKYQDLKFALSFLTQLWMYATPIVYPLSLVSEKWRWLLMLNPMASVIECNRLAFLGHGSVSIGYIILGWTMALALLLSGFILFNKIQRTFVDTI